jgi:hypothetical protein
VNAWLETQFDDALFAGKTIAPPKHPFTHTTMVIQASTLYTTRSWLFTNVLLD